MSSLANQSLEGPSAIGVDQRSPTRNFAAVLAAAHALGNRSVAARNQSKPARNSFHTNT